MVKCSSCNKNISFLKKESKQADGSVLCKNCLKTAKVSAKQAMKDSGHACSSCNKKITFIKSNNKTKDGLVCNSCLKAKIKPISMVQAKDVDHSPSTKKEAKQIVKKMTKEAPSNKLEITAKVKELGELKKEGLLTDEEFKLAKKKLLEKL